MINECDAQLPLSAIINHFSGRNRNLDFYENDIETLLEVEYGTAYAFMLLSLYCPINHDYEFHQDHIHPRKHFTRTQLRQLRITDAEQQEAYIERFNKLANLQLLQATPNMEKQAKLLESWSLERFKDPAELRQYKELHLFPAEQSLQFDNFVSFYDARKALIRARLLELLNVQPSNTLNPTA